MREAIARQQEQQDRELRVERHAVCDFCVGKPIWAYLALEIILTMDGRVMLERDAYRDKVIQGERASGRLVQRFDSGWLACDDCKALIDARDGELLILRWRTNTEHNELPAHFIDRAEKQLMRVHALFFEHNNGPSRIHALAEKDGGFK